MLLQSQAEPHMGDKTRTDTEHLPESHEQAEVKRRHLTLLMLLFQTRTQGHMPGTHAFSRGKFFYF